MKQLQRTFRVGATDTFVWQAGNAIDASAGVTLTIGAFGPAAMAQLITDATVTAISADLTTLTLAAPPSSGDCFVDFTRAYLVTDTDGCYPVEVTEISASTVTLGEPLHRAPVLTGAVSLQFATWTVAITAAQAVADYDGTEAVIEYTGELPGTLNEDAGLVRVVRRPFDTGLNHNKFLQMMPRMASRIPKRQQSFQQQIDAAFDDLAGRIRADLCSRDLTEDDAQPGMAQLARVHAYMVAALIMEDSGDFVANDHYLTQAFGPADDKGRRTAGLYETAVSCIWIDANRNGDVDEGEIESLGAPIPSVIITGLPAEHRKTMSDER